jgi:hypothetical protein
MEMSNPTDIERMSDADIRLNLEMQILCALTRHGGQVIVAGPQMESLIQDFIQDVLTHPERSRWADEYLRRLRAAREERQGP